MLRGSLCYMVSHLALQEYLDSQLYGIQLTVDCGAMLSEYCAQCNRH